MAGPRKSKHDIAPMIRGAFIRAAKGLEDDGKPLSTIIRECLESNPLGTLQALGKFIPREATVTGKVDHEHSHEHKHTHVAISEVNDWLNQFVGQPEGSDSKTSLPH